MSEIKKIEEMLNEMKDENEWVERVRQERLQEEKTENKITCDCNCNMKI